MARKANIGKIQEIRNIINNNTIDEEVAFDIETTGLSAQLGDKIIEIGAVKIKKGKIIDSFQTFIDPEMSISQETTKLTGITDADVIGQPKYDEALKKFKEFVGEVPLIAHNASFDRGFIKHWGLKCGINFLNPVIDTLEMARDQLRDMSSHKLNLVADKLGVEQLNHHRADDDARVCGEIYIKLKPHYLDNQILIFDYMSDENSTAKIVKSETPKKQIEFFSIPTSKKEEEKNEDKEKIEVNEIEETYAVTKTPAPFQTNLDIKKISSWERGKMKRIYVNGNSLTAFYDVCEMKWIIKNDVCKVDELHEAVCRILNVKSNEELANFSGIYNVQ